MARRKAGRDIETYTHTDEERVNNPPVGLVTPETDRDAGRRTYAHDPHLDPQLSWAGKAEHTSFEVPTVSLHVHERIDPRTVIEVRSSKQCASATVRNRRCPCLLRRGKTRRSARPSSSTGTATTVPTA